MQRELLFMLVMGLCVLILGIAYVWVVFPRRRPWVRYRANLRWYKASKKHLIYTIGASLPATVVVVHGFNYWTGKIKVRLLRATPGKEVIQQFNAHQLALVAWCNTAASKSTIVE